jgi:DNA-binding PadR family transcriptional regulator
MLPMAGTHVQMFILGSLTQGEAHGYQLLARAKLWGVEEWAGFGAGSIYNALRTLEKRGLVERSGTERRGGYAPATVYAITDEGRAELRGLLHTSAVEGFIHDPFDLVTPFLGLLPSDERKTLIQLHVACLERRRVESEAHYVHVKQHIAEGKPLEWVLVAMEKGQRMIAEAIASAQELLTRCEAWGPPEALPRAGGHVGRSIEGSPGYRRTETDSTE